MMTGLVFALTFLAALGCRNSWADSSSPFQHRRPTALARLPSAEGIAAMQSINAAVLNPLFGAAFFGTAAVCGILMLFSLWSWRDPGALWLLLGGVLYLGGALLVTIACNVPLNEALATLSPPGRERRAVDRIRREVDGVGNHLRTMASLAAAALLTIALCYRTGGPEGP